VLSVLLVFFINHAASYVPVYDVEVLPNRIVRVHGKYGTSANPTNPFQIQRDYKLCERLYKFIGKNCSHHL